MSGGALGMAVVRGEIPPVIANGAEQGGGVNLPLLIAAGGALALAAVLFALKARRWALVALAACVVLVLGGVFLRGGGEEGTSEATVSILEPRDGAQIEANEPMTVRVRVENGSIATSPTDEDGGHLHLFVDGKLQQMPYSTEAQITLPPGNHEVTVEYVDHEHVSFDPEIKTTVQVTAR